MINRSGKAGAASLSLAVVGSPVQIARKGLIQIGGNGILGTSTFGQLSLCEGFGLLPSFESQEMIQSQTGPDYSVEVRVGSTIEDRN